ncbi:MAG TPA: arsenate reductase (glutaredoxin) [Chitinophagales bacterium]|nr:arsenate reductase (glutaredoxin) [Chitinophagales bacterium]HMW13114.1 arsenate reductase (glutaredoxin) [Chitinophagales bacterium]HMX60193.1 arsenate reductase (glutaredoxin) [Chitinophagales bacterium]HNB49197.1 arsenate reductase (glutaredoxin) [Chitinophagales bacterium]HND84131.1 arsenate reductase (glutaredoxin) [Chitinophagales bacterium]
MITIYHNNRCGKSRSALCILEESHKPFTTVEYLKDTPSIEELKVILKKLQAKPHDIIRTKEAIYLEKYKGKNLSDEEWLQAMHENPILIERPIVINGDKAVVARPPEKVNEIL